MATPEASARGEEGVEDLATPTAGDGWKELGQSDPPSAASTLGPEESTHAPSDPTTERMRALGLGKKMEERARVPNPLGVAASPPSALRSGSPSGVFPPRSASPKFLPGSPSRIAQASPRVTSPTSSLIFERNVQEDGVPVTASPAIPAHITTENHIPPILEEASKAITDDHLDPDSVEIVTHAAHIPAATVVTAGSDMPLTPLQPATSMTSSLAAVAEHEPLAQSSIPELGGPPPNLGTAAGILPHGSEAINIPASEDGASVLSSSLSNPAVVPNYGSIADTNDVRRLSFISFADVVHAEQSVGGDAASVRDSALASPLAASSLGRSPSPLRSPISPSLSAASGNGSHVGVLGDVEHSPGRARAGSASLGLGAGSLQSSAILHSIQGSSPPIGNTGGELTIETMRQALRKTASGEFGSSRTSFGQGDGPDEAGR